MEQSAQHRIMLPPTAAFDISITLAPGKYVNRSMVRVTARLLRRRERLRQGLPAESLAVENEALDELLSHRVCLLARGEIESVARMSCEQLTRAGATPTLRCSPYRSRPTPIRDEGSGIHYTESFDAFLP